jgi:hypothetical protein
MELAYTTRYGIMAQGPGMFVQYHSKGRLFWDLVILDGKPQKMKTPVISYFTTF